MSSSYSCTWGFRFRCLVQGCLCFSYFSYLVPVYMFCAYSGVFSVVYFELSLRLVSEMTIMRQVGSKTLLTYSITYCVVEQEQYLLVTICWLWVMCGWTIIHWRKLLGSLQWLTRWSSCAYRRMSAIQVTLSLGTFLLIFTHLKYVFYWLLY